MLKREWLKAGFRRLNSFFHLDKHEMNILNQAGTYDELHVILPQYRAPVVAVVTVISLSFPEWEYNVKVKERV